MKTNFIFSSNRCLLLLASVFFILGCKNTPTQTAADLDTLMSEGNCQEIKQRVTGTSQSSQGKAALATCLLADAQDNTQKKAAADLIVDDSPSTTVTNGAALLRFATLYPSPQRTFQLSVIEVAFGLGNYGPMANGPLVLPGTVEAQELVIAILQFTHLSYLEGAAPNTADMAEIWTGCQHLLNNSFSSTDDYVAWSLHTSLAAVALRMWNPLNKTDLAYDLMRATVSVVEQNQAISVAARCDLAAPYERLKMALSKDTAILGPFERAVSTAMGCTRGKYAPQK